jgi:AMMECR1 domain-containing protein
MFLRHLKQKAGLPRDFWAPDVMLYRYSHAKWIDPPRLPTMSP